MHAAVASARAREKEVNGMGKEWKYIYIWKKGAVKSFKLAAPVAPRAFKGVAASAVAPRAVEGVAASGVLCYMLPATSYINSRAPPPTRANTRTVP